MRPTRSGISSRSALGSRASNQRVKRTADPEPAMSSIRGVMLLPISAKSYRSHTAHHTFLNKVNAPETVVDPKLALSLMAENENR